LSKPEAVGAARRPVISLYVAAALAAGLAVGASAEFNYASAIDLLLLFLFIASADMARVEVRLDRSVFLAPAVAFLRAGVVGFLFALAFHITPAVALGMGWYSFTCPYLASAGDTVGGAATMDNTLPLYTALYGSSFALYAFANGVILTALVPVIVPVIHQFYICCM